MLSCNNIWVEIGTLYAATPGQSPGVARIYIYIHIYIYTIFIYLDSCVKGIEGDRKWQVVGWIQGARDQFAVEPSMLHFLGVLSTKRSRDTCTWFLFSSGNLTGGRFPHSAIYRLARKWGPHHLLWPWYRYTFLLSYLFGGHYILWWYLNHLQHMIITIILVVTIMPFKD